MNKRRFIATFGFGNQILKITLCISQLLFNDFSRMNSVQP